MKLPLPLAFLFLAPFIAALAQDTPADVVRLEDLPQRFQKLDEELARKLDEVRALIEREAEAKRITEPVAQSMRWSLRTTAAVGSAIDVRAIVATMRVPTDNTALTQAIKELEMAYAAVQAQQSALVTSVGRDVRQRVAEVIRTAEKSADIDAIEAPLAKASELARRRTWSSTNEASQTISHAEPVLRGLRRLLEAEKRGQVDAIGQALNRFRNESRYGSEAAFDGEIQARIDRTMRPFAASAETAEEETVAAIVAMKPPAEISAALAKLDEAVERLAVLLQNSGTSGQRDWKQVASHYRRIAKIATPPEPGEGGTFESRLNEARNAVRSLGGARAAAIEPVIAKIEKQAAEAAENMANERGAKLRERIVAAKSPADLDAIADDMRDWDRASTRANRNEDWIQIAAQLSSLGAAWATNSPALLERDRVGGSERATGRFAAEIEALRKRIERDVLSRALAVPELNEPPLSEKAPDAALDALCDRFVEKGEWRRLYDVLSARAALQPNAPRRAGNDALPALQSFFTGQNLELAEQWADAVQAYKTVLQNSSPRAPIKPAAERIKALVKEHPDAANVTTPQARPQRFDQ
jgi:hypothetical protein